MSPLGSRVRRLVVVLGLVGTLIGIPASAGAGKSCSSYYHYHYYGSLHFYNLHEVYSTNPSGTGEWTYWWDSQWEYIQWNYYHVYYGSLYCA